MGIVQKILTLFTEAEKAGTICLGGLNPNIEYRNPKQIQNSNFPMFKTVTGSLLMSSSSFGHWNFEHSNLFRASCFGFRI